MYFKSSIENSNNYIKPNFNMDSRKSSLASSLGSGFDLRIENKRASIQCSKPHSENKSTAEEALNKGIQSIQSIVAEVQESLVSVAAGKNVKARSMVGNANRKLVLLKEEVSRIVGSLLDAARSKEKYKEKAELLSAKVAHSIDREMISRQKVTQINSKYKLKKREMESELKNYKKRYEKSKQIWAERQRVLEQDIEVTKAMTTRSKGHRRKSW